MKNCVFRGRRAELHIPLATQKLGFAIEPCRTAIFMDFMKNDSLVGFYEELRLHPPLVS